MGERTDRLTDSPEELEREVESIREEMDPILEELNYRRHELADIPRRVKEQVPNVLKAVAVLVGIALVAKAVHRGRRAKMMARQRRAAGLPIW